MLDWKSLVREKLGPIALDSEKRDQIVEELAQQLESAYQDEVAKGTDRFEAIRRSLAQFRDWEKLRANIFGSINGTSLPIWEQTGIFAPRRPLVWLALAIAACFLLLPSFRKALHMLSFLGQPSDWDQRAFSAAALQKISRSGDQQKYAQALAYVALHNPVQNQAAAAAEKAIAVDPQLTWISAHIVSGCCGTPIPNAAAWIDRLKAWDPDNAYPHLLAAQAQVHAESLISTKPYVPSVKLRVTVAANSRWRGEMQQAFSAPRMDSYVARQFALDRAVLLDQGLDYPDNLLLASASVHLPDLAMLKMYADYLVFDVGAGEESAGRPEKALAIYRNVALFGQRMADADTTVEQMFSAQIRKEALQKTIALLHREHKDAADAELALAATLNEENKSRLEFTSEPIAFRSGQLIMISAVLALLLVALTAVWLVGVAILRRWANLSRRVNGIASRLGWSPLALSISCVALYLSFLPYAKSIRDYSAQRELVAAFNGVYEGFYSLRPNHIPILDGVWIDHVFWPVVWCLAVVVVGIIALSWTSFRRPPTRLTE